MGNDEKTYKQKPRNVGPNRVNEKPKNLKLALRKLLHYMKRYIPFIVIALVLATLSSILVIIGPKDTFLSVERNRPALMSARPIG